MEYFAYIALASAVLIALLLVWGIFVCFASVVAVAVRFSTKSLPRQEAYVVFSKRLTYIALISTAIWQIYFAVYPGDDFYLAEFEVATLRKPPIESKVLAKHATYPDFHGDYCSFSRIAVDTSTYQHLISELHKDKRFTHNISDFIHTSMPNGESLPPARVLERFTRNDVESDHHYSVTFLEPGAMIEVQICVT